jgi:hypothetical protein
MSKISQFLSGRGHTSPLPELGRPQARLVHDFAKQTGWSSRGKHGNEGFHDILQRLTLGEPKGNECRQGRVVKIFKRGFLQGIPPGSRSLPVVRAIDYFYGCCEGPTFRNAGMAWTLAGLPVTG